MPRLRFPRTLFVTCPTGPYCREDRCQSFFSFDLIPTMRPPLEECEAAGAIRALGGWARVIDAPAARLSDDEFCTQVINEHPDLLVLAVTFGSLEADLLWAKRFKALLPSVPIAVRGAPAYTSARQVLDSGAVDMVLRGDYELVFHDLLTNDLEEAQGTVTLDASRNLVETKPPLAEDLDELPLPDRSVIQPLLYTVRGLRRAQATVRVARGCPFPCTYCLVHTVSGSLARHRSPRHITEEIQELVRSGTRFFYLRADTFSLKREWVLELCGRLQRDVPEARWVTTTRVECVDEELLAAMRRGGCYGISFGIDVASETIGQHVKKPVRLDLAEKAMRLCDRSGIVSLAYIMVGFMWDTQATLEEARVFIRKLRPDLLTIHFAHPYPGTSYFAAVEAAGRIVESSKAQAEPAFGVAELSTHELRRWSRRTLAAHYFRPSVWYSLSKKLSGLATRLPT